LAAVIKQVTAKWKADGQAPICAPRFKDLPAPILENAKQQGYDNASAEERITGVAKGKFDLVQENSSSATSA